MVAMLGMLFMTEVFLFVKYAIFKSQLIFYLIVNT